MNTIESESPTVFQMPSIGLLSNRLVQTEDNSGEESVSTLNLILLSLSLKLHQLVHTMIMVIPMIATNTLHTAMTVMTQLRMNMTAIVRKGAVDSLLSCQISSRGLLLYLEA
jgi:hypothetical protein